MWNDKFTFKEIKMEVGESNIYIFFLHKVFEYAIEEGYLDPVMERHQQPCSSTVYGFAFSNQ